MNRNGSSLLLAAVTGLIVTPFEGLNAATPTPTPKPSLAKVSEVMTKALAERDNLPAAVGSLWRFEGPTDLNRGSRTDSGRINEIAIDPTHPQTMYVTGATGGVWKTVDGGITWAARSQGWPIQAATAVAIDPNDSNRVFVGTGDYKRLDWVEPFSVGIMRSLDAGLTWSNVGAKEMREFTVSRIVFCNSPVILTDPFTGRTTTTTLIQHVILAATGRGSRLPGGHIFRSTDGGTTWRTVVDDAGQPLPDANWDDLESCGGTLWASATQRHNLDEAVGASETGLLYKSANGGQSWTKVTVITPAQHYVTPFNLDSGSNRPDTIQIACNAASTSSTPTATASATPTTPHVYVAVYQNSKAHVFVTPDTGATWSEMTEDSNYPVPVGGGAWAHAAFGVDGNRLYIGGVEMFLRKSVIVMGLAFDYFKIEPAVGAGDFHCVVPDPTTPDAVFVACDGGIYRYNAVSDKVDKAHLNKTLGVTQIFRMDVHARNGNWIAIGSQDNGSAVNFHKNGNALDAPPVWRKLGGGDGRSVAFRQDDSSRVYLANTDYNVSRYDGTATSDTSLLTNGASLLVSLGKQGAQGPLLYSNDKLYSARTTFSWLENPESKNLISADWESVEFANPKPAFMQSLAFCPSNPQVIYAGSQIGELFRSTNGGQSWAPGGTKLPTDRPIWAISPSATNCDDVLVAVGYEGQQVIRKGDNVFSEGARLFHKTDVLMPGFWSDRHGGPPSLPHAPLYAIARLRSAPASKWFVAGDAGVFRTDDSGNHWANATAPLGLPNTLVRDLRLSLDGNTLYAGTFGRGVWSMDVNPPPDHFGVRGTVTRRGGPVSGIRVKASGGGRIKKFLRNTLTTGPIASTAPIKVSETATISEVAIYIVAINANSAILVTPDNAELEMMLAKTLPLTPEDAALLKLTPGEAALLNTFGGTSLFSLSKPSELVGKPSKGSWSFKVAGVGSATPPSGLSPSIVTGFVDLSFQNGVSDVTGEDGEFTLEYLNRGKHDISLPGSSICEVSEIHGRTECTSPIDLQSNKTDLNFRKTNQN